MILHGAIKLWWHVKTAREFFFFLRCAWFGIQSINQSTKLNWMLITFQVEIVALMLCVQLYFTTLRLVENDVSLAWMRPFEMHLLLVLLNKPNLRKSACINHNLFTCCFSRFIERCDVIVTHYFMKVKWFFLSVYTLPKLVFYSDSIICMLWFCSRGVKSCFHKRNGDGTQDARDVA